jgi:hypothetical protein
VKHGFRCLFDGNQCGERQKHAIKITHSLREPVLMPATLLRSGDFQNLSMRHVSAVCFGGGLAKIVFQSPEPSGLWKKPVIARMENMT